MDVVIALDTWNDVTAVDFADQLDFLTNLINAFTISANKTRIGVILYATEPSEAIALPQYNDTKALTAEISKLTANGGTAGNNRVNNMMMMAKASSWRSLEVLLVPTFTKRKKKA